VSKRLLEKLLEKKSFLDEWLRRAKKARDVEQNVIQMRDETNWQIKTVASMPSDNLDFDLNNFTMRIDKDIDQIKQNYPWMPDYEISPTGGTAVITSATSTDFVDRVVGPSTFHPENEVSTWAKSSLKSYSDIQEAQGRESLSRSFLYELNSERGKEFDKAKKSVQSAKVGSDERTKAGNEMRNLLNHLKGDLFEKARKTPRENMSWQIMVDRLGIGEEGEVEQQELMKQKEKWHSLQIRLTDITKNQEGGYVTDIEATWRQLIDHIYTIRGLIDWSEE